MKRLIFFLIATLIALPVFCQEDDLKKLENLENNAVTKTDSVYKPSTKKRSESKASDDSVTIKVGDEIFSVKELGDETKIKIGKKEYRIVEDNDGVRIYRNSRDSYHT